VQVARPGHRLPHAWLERYGVAVATHDLVAPGAFILLTGDDGSAWADAAAVAAERLGAALVVHRVGRTADLRDRSGAWEALRGHDERGAVLVRPDGHVAYRAATAVDDPQAALDAALRVALGAGQRLDAGVR
jgi:2,4-dichlorophenol 6-monooxygenase